MRYCIAFAIGCWCSVRATPLHSDVLHYQWDGCPAKYTAKLNETVRGGAHYLSDIGAVRCCSDNDNTCESAVNGCHPAANWTEAKQICEKANRRLCTLTELQAGICCGSGCDFDWKTSVWTSTEAKILMQFQPCGWQEDNQCNITVTLGTAKAAALCYAPAYKFYQRCGSVDLQHGQAVACCSELTNDDQHIEAGEFELFTKNHISGSFQWIDEAPCTAMGRDGQDRWSYAWADDIFPGRNRDFGGAKAVDGCQIRNYGSLDRSYGEKALSNVDPWATHAVRCCTYDGGACITPTNSGCEGTATWWEAHAACHQIGLRLCSKEEVDDDKCCASGCMFDVDFVWTWSPY